MEVLSETCRKSLPPAAPESCFLHASVNLVFDFAMFFLEIGRPIRSTLQYVVEHFVLGLHNTPADTASRLPETADPPSNNAIDFRTSRAICVFHFANLGMSRAIR